MLRHFLRRYSQAAANTDCILSHLEESGHQGISVLTLNRPQAKNAIGKQLILELQQHIASLRSSKKCRVLIIRSSTPGVFCAGADLKERVAMTPEEVAPFVRQLRNTFTDLERLPFPVVAAVDGVAVGGGLEMALAADLRIASESSQLGLPETKLAIVPGAGGTQRLPRLVGLSKAKELIFTGKLLTGREASDIGLVNQLAPEGKSYDHAVDLAKALLERGPIALSMAKLAIQAGYDVDLASGLAIEEMCYAQVIPTKDRTEALKAFQERRKPIFIGG